MQGQGRGGRVDGVPRGFERGPARVRSEAMRIDIAEEKAWATATGMS